MKTADSMFEELGFKKVIDTDKEVQYNYDAMILGDICTHTILFSKVGKIIFSKYKDTNEMMGLGVQELKAINEKCKELRMDIEEWKDVKRIRGKISSI